MVLSFLKYVAVPGSASLFLWAMIGGLLTARFFPRARTVARIWMGLFVVAYLTMALPPVAAWIAAPFPPALAGAAQPIDTVIFLEGDNQSSRVAAAAELVRTRPHAGVLALAEPKVVADLVAAGIPANRITADDTGRTTGAQMDIIARRIGARDRSRMALVVSRIHAVRVRRLVQTRALTGINVIAAPLEWDRARSSRPWFMPGIGALFVSRDALYERVALAYYRWHGWI